MISATTPIQSSHITSTVECFDSAVKPEPEPISGPIPTCNHATSEVLCAHVTTTDSRLLSVKEQLNMPGEGRLTSDQQEQLEELILDCADVFSLTDSDLGHTIIVQYTIDSGDHQPIKQQPRCMPLFEGVK